MTTCPTCRGKRIPCATCMGTRRVPAPPPAAPAIGYEVQITPRDDGTLRVAAHRWTGERVFAATVPHTQQIPRCDGDFRALHVAVAQDLPAYREAMADPVWPVCPKGHTATPSRLSVTEGMWFCGTCGAYYPAGQVRPPQPYVPYAGRPSERP